MSSVKGLTQTTRDERLLEGKASALGNGLVVDRNVTPVQAHIDNFELRSDHV